MGLSASRKTTTGPVARDGDQGGGEMGAAAARVSAQGRRLSGSAVRSEASRATLPAPVTPVTRARRRATTPTRGLASPAMPTEHAAPHVPVCLSIAGSDSGGGAGIQADLKAFARCGVHGTTAITALTAQNTVAVTRMVAVDPDMVVAQIEAVASDLGVAAVKIGMVGGAAVIEAVAAALDALPGGTPVVLDPVMIAESGARLLPGGAEQALIDLLLPRATVVTPNVPEARVLARAGDDLDGAELARAVRVTGANALVVTRG